MRVLAVVATFAILALTTSFAQEIPLCRIVRADGAGILQKCGDTLRSFSLQTSDMRGRAGRDLHGRFYFGCRLTPDGDLLDALRERKSNEPNYSCRAEPSISGFFFDPAVWWSSRHDEQAILAVLALGPYNSWVLNDRNSPALKTNCAVFDALVDDLPAKAVCFGGSDIKVDTIIVVAADDRVGAVLSFSKKDQSAEVLRSQVREILSRFSIDRGSGDAALLKWIR